MRNKLWILLSVVLICLLAPTWAWAAPLGQEGEVTTDALWTTLAPLAAIATSIERLLEAFWDRLERTEPGSRLRKLADPDAENYGAKKRIWSHWLGTFIAIGAVGLTNVRFFHLLGFEVLFSAANMEIFHAGIGGIFDHFTFGTLIDWVVTAGIIGWGGTELTHSVIEGLVKGRNLWKEMQEVQEGRKSIVDAKFFNDYIAPQLEERGVSVAGLRQALQELSAAGMSVDRFIGDMTVGQAERLLVQMEQDPQKAAAAQAMRTVLEGVPEERRVEVPNILSLLTSDQRQRFLGG